MLDYDDDIAAIVIGVILTFASAAVLAVEAVKQLKATAAAATDEGKKKKKKKLFVNDILTGKSCLIFVAMIVFSVISFAISFVTRVCTAAIAIGEVRCYILSKKSPKPKRIKRLRKLLNNRKQR